MCLGLVNGLLAVPLARDIGIQLPLYREFALARFVLAVGKR